MTTSTGPDAEPKRFAVEHDPLGFLRVRWDRAVDVTLTDIEPDAAERGRTAAQASADIPPVGPMMICLNGMRSFTQEALVEATRRLRVTALALVGPSAFDDRLVDIYHEVYTPTFPVRYFDDEVRAARWLLSSDEDSPTHPHGTAGGLVT